MVKLHRLARHRICGDVAAFGACHSPSRDFCDMSFLAGGRRLRMAMMLFLRVGPCTSRHTLVVSPTLAERWIRPVTEKMS